MKNLIFTFLAICCFGGSLLARSYDASEIKALVEKDYKEMKLFLSQENRVVLKISTSLTFC